MAGTDSYIQLPVDSTGKKVRGWVNTVGANDVYAQAMVITDIDGVVQTSATGIWVGGHVAHDAVDAGNPIKIGGYAATSAPTAVAAADRVNAWFTLRGEQAVTLTDGGGNYVSTTTLADGASASTVNVAVKAGNVVYNGSTWDRMRGDTNGTYVGGNVAHDGVDAGNPIKVGGKASSSVPTDVASGDRVNAWFNLNGTQNFTLSDTSGNQAFTKDPSADSQTSVRGLVTYSQNMIYTGTDWARMRGGGSGIFVQGGTSNDSSVSGQNPLIVGGIAVAAPDTLSPVSASGDAVFSVNDYYGRPSVVVGSVVTAADSKSNSTAIVGLTPHGVSGVAGILTVAQHFFNGSTWDRMRGDTTQGLWIGSAVAHDAVDSGNPIKIGGLAKSSTPSSVSNNDRVNAWYDIVGSQSVFASVISSGGDAVSNSNLAQLSAQNTATGTLLVAPIGYNGTSWDRLRTIDALSSAPNVKTGILAVGTGPGFDIKLDPTALATALNSAITQSVDGATWAVFHWPTGTTGTVIFELSYDGSNWITAPYAVRGDNLSAGATGSITPQTNDIYRVYVGGARQVRIRVSSALGATLGVKLTLTSAYSEHIASSVDGVKPGPAAYLVGYNGSTWDRVRTANTGRLQVDVVTGGGGGTQYVEDVAFGGNGTGSLMIARRDDALSTLTPVEDDAVGLRVNSKGALWTRAVPHAVSSTASADGIGQGYWIDEASSAINPIGYLGYTVNNVSTLDKIKGANTDTQTAAGIQAIAGMMYNGSTYERPRGITPFKTAGSTPDVGLQATIAPDRRYTSVALGTVVSNTQAWDCNGADAVIVHIGSTQTGTFIFEVTADDTNWVSAEVRDTQLDLWVSGTNLTPTNNKTYRIIANGWRQIRARTVTTLNGTVAMTATLAASSTVINAIDTGPAPHAIGYPITSKTVQVTTTQTGSDVWSPATGKFICITSVQVQAGGTTAGTMQLWFGANADTTYTRGTDLAIFDGEWAPSATNKPGVIMQGPFVSPTVDYEVHLTTSAAINPLTVTLWGYEF